MTSYWAESTTLFVQKNVCNPDKSKFTLLYCILCIGLTVLLMSANTDTDNYVSDTLCLL